MFFFLSFLFAYQLEKLTEFEDVVWGFCFLNEDRMLVTLQSGEAFSYEIKTKKTTKLTGIPSSQRKGQGGLMDIKCEKDGIYLTYTHKVGSKQTTRLAKAQLEGNTLKDLKVLFSAEPALNSGRHFGSRIAFDEKGFLYISLGDRGSREQSQELNNQWGTVIRLKPDGSIPEDNPFVGQKNAKPEIWSYGHRNPQGLDYDFKSKKLWLIEHGPRGGDEINLVEKAKNYGWPVITYGKEYWGPSIGEGTAKEGMQQPVHQFTPSIAPSTLLHYSGKKWKDLEGKLLSGALKLKHINVVHLKEQTQFAKEERLFEDLDERFRHIEESPEGEIFASTDSGKLYRFTNSKAKSTN